MPMSAEHDASSITRHGWPGDVRVDAVRRRTCSALEEIGLVRSAAVSHHVLLRGLDHAPVSGSWSLSTMAFTAASSYRGRASETPLRKSFPSSFPAQAVCGPSGRRASR